MWHKNKSISSKKWIQRSWVFWGQGKLYGKGRRLEHYFEATSAISWFKRKFCLLGWLSEEGTNGKKQESFITEVYKTG